MRHSNSNVPPRLRAAVLSALPLIIFISLNATLRGQETVATIKGRVTDVSGQGLADVAVTAQSAALVGALTTRTTGNGEYRFIALPPGPYVLTRPTTVIQLISMAGGLLDYADQKQISVMRIENGKPVSYAFNYKDVANRKNLQQNIELVLGDTVVVP